MSSDSIYAARRREGRSGPTSLVATLGSAGSHGPSVARALPPAADAAFPFAVPDVVLRVHRELDWDSFLPPRAATRSWRVRQALKRALDVMLSAAGLVVLSPLFLLLALLVAVTSRGPILYEWKVLGKRARPFVGYKFRTMVVNADELKDQFLSQNEMRGPVFKMRRDPRITPIGRWLRKFSLDELPQLWSVLRGDMSLVGPRPPFPHEFADFEPWQWGKLSVTPGITCIWQVSGRSEIVDFDDWVAMDMDYIRNWSLWLDFKILLMTVPAVLRGHGAY